MRNGVTRRAYNIRCYWWKFDEDNPNSEDYETKKYGKIFFARESQETLRHSNTDNGLVDFDYQSLTIESCDDLHEMRDKDLVEFDGERYIVTNVQSKRIAKQSQYNTRMSRIYWISLRNGGQ